MRDVRADFPILERKIEGDRIVYLDSAATSLKPQPVIDAVTRFYTEHTSNVHRAIHRLGEEATEGFEGARRRLARLLGAEQEEIVFTRGATEAIHLVRSGFPGLDRVATTAMDHHSNLLAWGYGPSSTILPVDRAGEIDLAAFERVLEEGVDLVAVPHISNVLGTVVAIEPIIERAHAHGALVLVDAAQSAPHQPIDVKALGADFLVCSAHKMLGPSGVGLLYAKREHLDRIEPRQIGGSVVSEVHLDGYTLQEVPHRFEAGTPAIESVIGWGAAAEYLMRLGLESVAEHDRRLVAYADQRLRAIDHVDIVGPTDPGRRGALVSFQVQNLEAHGVAKMLGNRANVLVRSGFHCAQPLHESLGLLPTVRASFYVYNTEEDIDELADCLTSITALL